MRVFALPAFFNERAGGVNEEEKMELLRVAKQRLDRAVLMVTSVVSFWMIVIVFIQVIARYIMHDSLSWSEEIARYLLVWTIFLSAGYVLGQGAHIFLDVVFNNFPQNISKTNTANLLFYS